jgi:hypothetical protein
VSAASPAAATPGRALRAGGRRPESHRDLRASRAALYSIEARQVIIGTVLPVFSVLFLERFTESADIGNNPEKFPPQTGIEFPREQEL